jgi:pyruvate ferredoxin oxidoreductase delta subunit
MTDSEARVSGINFFFCKGCAICEAVCPAHAISMHPESEFTNDDDTAHGSDPGKVGEFIVA